jgi:gliding motility-associated-like protein
VVDTILGIDSISLLKVYALPANDTLIALGTSIKLYALANQQDISIEWSPTRGLSTPFDLITTAGPLDDTRYTVSVTNSDSCTATASVLINVDTNKKVYVPNVFTPLPNIHNDNDWITVYGNAAVELVKEFSIYDRWGSKVFESKDFLQGTAPWNGKFDGKDAEPAVYTWMAKVLFVDGDQKWFYGNITLLR